MNQRQLLLTGQTNSILNSDIVQNIVKLDNRLQDPTILNQVIQGIQGGLSRPSTPQVEALQYYTLSRINPNANLWEMNLMREDPFGRGKGYFSEFLENLMQLGDLNTVKFNVKEIFGLSYAQTDALINGIARARRENRREYQDENGNFDISKYLEGGNLNFRWKTAMGNISSKLQLLLLVFNN